jgi:hypothetical protein
MSAHEGKAYIANPAPRAEDHLKRTFACESQAIWVGDSD